MRSDRGANGSRWGRGSSCAAPCPFAGGIGGHHKTKEAPENPEPLLHAVEATPGFEPGVKALQASALPLGHVADLKKPARRSIRPAFMIKWSGRRDSNPRPQPWQGYALPAEPRPRARKYYTQPTTPRKRDFRGVHSPRPEPSGRAACAAATR